MIVLTDAIKEQAEYLAYSINPIGMPYEQWRMMVRECQGDIAGIEAALSELKVLLGNCLES